MSHPSPIVNVGARLTEMARQRPEAVAVAAAGRRLRGSRTYRQVTFRELDQDSDALAAALRHWGAGPGTRLVLMVPPGVDFIALVFAMFKAGVVVVLIDPGMGRRSLLQCLQEVRPEGFVAVPRAQAVRCLLRRRFPQARLNVTVGRRWFWGGPTLAQLRCQCAGRTAVVETTADTPAAVIFTTGSTGPPKGVLYRHGNFQRQADEIGAYYGIQPGEVDLAAFPLFALFNAALGVTTVIPEMDASRPAAVDPRNIIEAVQDWQATQAFGSPALWNVVGRYCETHSLSMPSLRRVLSAGAPVPPHVLRRVRGAIHPEGDIHTPYGATEALPVASISGREVLQETEQRTRQGQGVCVGRRFPGIQWKVIRISDAPIETIDQAELLPAGEIGELIVCGPVVTSQYATRQDCNPLHKVRDGQTLWHRLGDVGYLEDRGGEGDERFWYCGRKSQRVLTRGGVMFTIPCEAIFNQHPRIYRSALVGIGAPGAQQPAVVVEPWPDQRPADAQDETVLRRQLAQLAQQHALTRSIQHILIHPSLPVDIRHNSKIFREQLARWAEQRLSGSS